MFNRREGMLHYGVLALQSLSVNDIGDINELMRRLSPHAREVGRSDIERVIMSPHHVIGVVRDMTDMRGSPENGRIVCMGTLTVDEMLLRRRAHIEDLVATSDHTKGTGAKLARHLTRAAKELGCDLLEFRVAVPAVAARWRERARETGSTFQEKSGFVYHYHLDGDYSRD